MIFIASAALLFICTQLFGQHTIQYSHADMNGIVSVEAEHFFQSNGWNTSHYYTGNAVSPARNSNPDSSFIRYKIDFSSPGKYALCILSNRKRSEKEEKINLRCNLFDADSSLLQSVETPVPDMYAPIWSGVGTKLNIIDIKQPGEYFLQFEYSSNRFSLDKFVLANPDNLTISGIGPAETCKQNPSPAQPIKTILPPAWAFGVLFGGYTNQEQTLNTVNKLIEGDFPIDAYWIDSYFWDFNQGKGPGGYINFVGDTVAFPNYSALWDSFEKNKIKGGIWIWNLISQNGNEDVFSYFNDHGYFKNVYKNTNGWHNASKNTMTGQINFENDKAIESWKKQLKPFFDSGLDFLKLDNSSEIPFCKAAFTATQEMGKETQGRGFIMAHIHTVSDERAKLYPTRWTGDAKICWSQPDYPNLYVYAMGGFKQNIAMVADPKRTTYEMPFLTHDAGGYDYFGSTEQSNELYMRWIQFASLNSMMTIFSTAKNPTRNHPYNYPKEVQDNYRKYTHLRMRLFPYIYSNAILTRLTGEKMVKGDGIHEYQYLLGNAFLVAPVYTNGSREKTLFLPAGDWVDFETDSLYTGGRTVTVPAPLTKIPLFVKTGAIIPFRNYARAIELGNNDTLTMHIYPSEKLSTYTLYEDDGISNDYLEGLYSSTFYSVVKTDEKTLFKIDAVKGSFKNMNPRRFYRLNFHLTEAPKTVLLSGKRIKKSKNKTQELTGWEYDKSNSQLLITFRSLKSEPGTIEIDFRH